MNRAPWPIPQLSARMRPPCASTSPLQMMSPRLMPAAARPPPSACAYLRNRCGSRSGRRQAPALVADRDGDVRAVTLGRDPDRGRVGRVPGGVREQVVEHLHDARPIGQHPGQVRRQVDEHGVPAAGGQERAARPVDQLGHLGGLGGDRERARLNAPGIEQVADEPAHVIGLLGDDAVGLVPLGRVERGGAPPAR